MSVESMHQELPIEKEDFSKTYHYMIDAIGIEAFVNLMVKEPGRRVSMRVMKQVPKKYFRRYIAANIDLQTKAISKKTGYSEDHIRTVRRSLKKERYA